MSISWCAPASYRVEIEFDDPDFDVFDWFVEDTDRRKAAIDLGRIKPFVLCLRELDELASDDNASGVEPLWSVGWLGPIQDVKEYRHLRADCLETVTVGSMSRPKKVGLSKRAVVLG